MATLSSANTKYTAEQLIKATGISAETLATWGLTEATDTLTMSQLAEMASSDAQAKKVLEKIVAQNAQSVANGEVTASNVALTASEGGATLATGAFTTAIKANISAMKTWLLTTPAGWLTMLVGGIFLAVKAYDALTVSVEEQKGKMEESLSAYEDAKSELSNITTELKSQEQAMDELLAKEKLTYAEKGQLEELQAITRELRIQKDLAEKEERRTKKEVATDASDLFKKQFGIYDISESAINEYQNNADITGNNAILTSDENDISAMIAGYKQFNKLLDEAYGEENQDNIDHFKSLTDDLNDSIFSTARDLQKQQDNISDYYNTIKDIPYEDLTTEQKEIVDSYNAISNAISLIYQQLDPNTWNSMQVDDIFSTDGIEKTKDELVAMAQSGELTPETIKGYTNLNNALGETTLSAQDLCNELYAIADAQGEVQGSTLNETDIQLGISETISQLNTQLKPAFDSLSKAWKEIFTIEDGQEIFSLDSVDTDMLYSIQETISKLNELDEVSIDTQSYENLARVLTNANSTADDVKRSFNEFATSIVDGVTVTNEFNESTKDTCIKLMEEMGIVNADEIVIQKLNKAKLNYKIASLDFSKTTADEIRELVSYGESLNLTKQQVFGLYIQQLQLNNNPIQAKNSIIQLYSLTKAGTETANALLDVYKMMDLISKGYQALENGGLSKEQKRVTELEISKLENKINKRLSDMVQDVDVNWDGLYPDKEETKSSAKDTTESFDWIERAVESLQNRFNSLQKIVDSTFTTTAEKAKALSDQLGLINKEIELQQYAYEEYMSKAESVGLSDNYKSLVQNGAISIEDIADEELKKAIDAYTKWYDKAKDTQDKINDLYDKSKDLHVSAFENGAKELEKLRDSQAISEREYLDRMTALWEFFYKTQVELAEVAKEKKLELLDEEKSYLQSVAGAASKLLDMQIDSLEDQKDSAVQGYKDQIEAIEKQKSALQDQLEQLENERKERELILGIQEKQYNLNREMNQRSQYKYVNDQMIYDTDGKAIKEAKTELDNARYELTKFNIEQQIDAYDKQINKLNELIDQTEKYYDAQIDGLNKYKDEWQKALDMEELAVNMKNFTNMFGENSIGKLLSGDMSLIKDWKQSYLDTLSEIDITSNGTIGEITKQFADLAGIDLSNTSAQTQDITSQFDTLGESVHTVTSSISNPDDTENEEDINSLTSAIQTSYSVASEAIPAQTEMMNSYTNSVQCAIDKVNELISSIERLSNMSITVPNLSGNAYANGTRNAEKGLALIGEEKPELVVTNDDKVLVAEKPTLVNMEGGEKVFNGDETKNLFENKSIRPLRPEDSPILHKISQMNPDDIMAKFGINSAIPVRSTLFDTSKSIANSNMVNNNNKPSYSVGDVHIHCPGVTKDEVAKQIGTEMTKTFFGLENKALQRANITR